MRVHDKTPQVRPNQTQPGWEYRSQRMDLDADLTQFAQEGWELVSVVPVQHDPSQAIYYFKRRR
jgi:hypothetical protein